MRGRSRGPVLRTTGGCEIGVCNNAEIVNQLQPVQLGTDSFHVSQGQPAGFEFVSGQPDSEYLLRVEL